MRLRHPRRTRHLTVRMIQIRPPGARPANADFNAVALRIVDAPPRHPLGRGTTFKGDHREDVGAVLPQRRVNGLEIAFRRRCALQCAYLRARHHASEREGTEAVDDLRRVRPDAFQARRVLHRAEALVLNRSRDDAEESVRRRPDIRRHAAIRILRNDPRFTSKMRRGNAAIVECIRQFRRKSWYGPKQSCPFHPIHNVNPFTNQIPRMDQASELGTTSAEMPFRPDAVLHN